MIAIKYNVAVFRLLAWRTHEFQHGAQALALLWPIADVVRCHAQCFAFASNCARARRNPRMRICFIHTSSALNNGRLHRSNYAIPDKSSNFEQGGKAMHLHIRAGGEREPPSVEIILPNGVKR